jgi:hypothetical protein
MAAAAACRAGPKAHPVPGRRHAGEGPPRPSAPSPLGVNAFSDCNPRWQSNDGATTGEAFCTADWIGRNPCAAPCKSYCNGNRSSLRGLVNTSLQYRGAGAEPATDWLSLYSARPISLLCCTMGVVRGSWVHGCMQCTTVVHTTVVHTLVPFASSGWSLAANDERRDNNDDEDGSHSRQGELASHT